MKKKLLIALLCLLIAAFGTLTVFSSDLASRCDVDGDGSVTVLDALIVLRYITDGEIKPDHPDVPVKPFTQSATIVLTATDKVNAVHGEPLAEQGYVQFRMLNEYGQIEAKPYYCQASALDITDKAEQYLFHSYNVKSTDGFNTFTEVEKVEAVKTDKVTRANQGTITINGTTYRLVEFFSRSNTTAGSGTPEIILRHENNGYAPILLYNTVTAYPEILLFDDNGDGTPDRGLYKEYQLGQYKLNNRIVNVDGSGIRNYLSNPLLVGKTVEQDDRIVYSYNETANVLYVKEKAQKISGVIGGLNISAGKITVGGVEYAIGIANLPGAWTTVNLTANMLGKYADIYTIEDKIVYFTDYANSSEFVVFDSHIGINQIGYPNVYAYIQNNVKKVITVSSFEGKTTDYSTDSSWVNEFIANANCGDLFTGSKDLNGYYKLSSSVEMTKSNISSAEEFKLLAYSNNKVRIPDASIKTLTEDTVFIVVTNGIIKTAKGLYAKAYLPSADTTLLTANVGASYIIVCNSANPANIDFIYVSDGAFTPNVPFSQSSKFIVYDSYIGINQLGYPCIYGYIQNNTKEILTVSSVHSLSDIPYVPSNTFEELKSGATYYGTPDSRGYYDLEAASDLPVLTEGGTIDLLPDSTGVVTVFGSTPKIITDDTVFLVVDKGKIKTAKGLRNSASTTLLTANAGAQYKTIYNGDILSFVYVSDGIFSPLFLKTTDAVVYLDEDLTLLASQSINNGYTYTWEYTYTNAIDVVNGGLLPYNIVCYNYPLTTGNFYLIRDGAVVFQIKALDVAAAEREMADARASGENLLLSETVAYQTATTDENGNVYLYKFPAGYGLSAADINASNQTCTVFFPSTAYVGTPAVSYSNVNFIGYTLKENGIQNTAADSVTPKDFSGDTAYLNALRTKEQYIFNYLGIGGSMVGSDAMPNIVCIADYNSVSHQAIAFKRQYKSIEDATNPTVTVDNPNSFVEYIIYKTTSGPYAMTNWDRLRTAVSGPATGDVDVTNAIKLFAADGTFVDPAKYGLTYTLKDALVFAYNDKQAYLEVRRDPMNKEVLAASDDYYMTFELNGSIYLCDKITISLAGSEVWYNVPACIIKNITATAGGKQFTLFIELGETQLTLTQIEYALQNMRLTLYKGDAATGNYAVICDVIRLVKWVNIYGTEFAFTLEAHEIFTPGDYAFELSFPAEPLNLNHAIEFAVA